MLKSRSMLALFMGMAVGLPAVAQDWPRFRGVNGTGVSDAKLPATFTEKDYAWKIALPGEGHSSPVLWGDRIFLTCAEKDSAKRYIVCINARDGSTKWKRDFPSTVYQQHKDNSYASSTPAVDADHIYVCWSTPQEYALLALDHDGKDVWKFGLGPYKSQHGSGTSPIVLQDMVILSNDQEGPSYIVALDAKTGKVRWKTDRHGTAMAASTPIVYHGKDGKDQVIFSQQQLGLSSLDAASGKVLWEISDAFGLRTVGSPYVAGDVVVGTCGQGPKGGNMVAAKPDAANGGKGTVAWKTTQSTPYVPTPVCKGDLIFIWSDVGVVTCLKASTGEQVWQEKVGGAYYSSPIIAGDKIYCVSKKGEVVTIAAANHYELLGRSQLGELTHATPAIAGGRMYLRTLTHLICIGSKQAG